jgi:hypothetical protein
MSEFKTITPAGRTIVTNLTTEELIIMISELKNKLEWYENQMSNKEDNDGFISLNSMDEYEKIEEYYDETEKIVKKLKDLEYLVDRMNA